MTTMTTASLLWALLFSSIGLGYFIYGKRQARLVIRYVGIVLMIYPYFISNAITMVAIGLALIFLPKFVRT